MLLLGCRPRRCLCRPAGLQRRILHAQHLPRRGGCRGSEELGTMEFAAVFRSANRLSLRRAKRSERRAIPGGSARTLHEVAALPAGM